MNFFEHQDWARRRTGLLILLFVVAVILIVLVTNVAVFLILRMSGWESVAVDAAGPGSQWISFTIVGVAVVGLIAGASGIKAASLRRGGGAVAEMLGGRLLGNLSEDPHEQRLMNVVEEMAIASGTPVPLVYVLDNEPGINAFAAGHGSEDAAVAVTRGALEQFTRDELQGVIAHEFSHILNKDVRINTRLTGLLFGILVLSVAGRLLLQGGSHVRIGRSSDRGGAGIAVALGLALMIIGYVGLFFGRLIKQAVSRQREFLADASAVQFTRNPEGLADALRRIGGWSEGSVVQTPVAEEVSHFFFANGMKASLFGKLLSTHPPLEDRIKRLDPAGFRDPEGHSRAQSLTVPGVDHAVGSMTAGFVQPAPPVTLAPDDEVSADAADILDTVGTTRPENLVYDELIEIEVPDEIRARLDSTFGAVAVLFALLLDANDGRRALQLDLLAQRADPALIREVTAIYSVLATVDRFARLPIADLAMPSLRGMSGEQYIQFRESVDMIIDSDQHLTLHEYAIRSIVRYRLDRHYGVEKQHHFRPSRAVLAADAAIILSGLARVGHESEAEVARAYELARTRFGDEANMPSRVSSPTALEIDAAVNRVSQLPDRRKRAIVQACAYSVLADETVRLDEAELLRVVVVALGCPLPPFMPKVTTRGAAA
jgi:Zn-dependent protease with chaperone function